ncbi:ABC transporter permease [Mariniblastus fucicola]|uniref:FtsX-like permease family protein n=1 Tax=Mariniblastus fucicola TaxID=980251 RepID=A0A5B9P282_9BACT|nr:ABC transporter permease [Mariniblastus fucicola]QEG20438.1 FtsX-like permease family protein [Mariniblastus fucicola]
MRKLDQKLLRDLSRMKGQIVAISLVIGAGIAVFTMAMCAYATLKDGQENFYRNFRFADVFASTRRCPASVEQRINEIEGVSEVETRLVHQVLLDVPDMVEPATARLISIPDRGQSKLNQVYIRRGRMPEPDRDGEVVVSEMFAEVHQFVPGDTVQAIINGKLQRLKIVGIALCPEYIIQIQSGSMLPDKKRFGIFWMNERELEAAFDMSGAFNSVSLKLAWNSDSNEVIDRLDQILEPFGSTGAYDRDDNVSHRFVDDELMQLRTMATVAPLIFLSVAAFLLNIVITRIITQQREQIAALKAFGYSNFEVGMHYLNLVLIISIGGMLIGTFFGYWMATKLTGLYHEFYKFPTLATQVNRSAVAMALLLTTTISVVGTWLAVGKAIKLPPAEAMRPEPPADFRPTRLDKLIPLHLLPAAMRMVFRNVRRKPIKSLASVFGIAMSVAVLIVGAFSGDSLDYLLDLNFRKAQRQDLTVGFVEPATESVVFELSNLPGVQTSEAIRSVPSRIRFGHRSRRIGLTGLELNPQLFRLLDSDEDPVRIPEYGVMLNSQLASTLGCGLGDSVTVEVLEDERPTLDLEVTAVVDEFGGMNAYMSKHRLHRALKESSVASGAFLKVDPNFEDDIYQELRSRPGVGNVSIKDATIESFTETIADNMLIMRTFNIMFAVIIAIGVVYNSARISLSEQKRDLSTMRVIGFTRAEVSTVLLGEIGLFTALALPLGCLIGMGLAWILIQGLSTESFRIPFVIGSSTYAFACMVVAGSAVISGWIVQRRIATLDLVSALKTRE